MMSNWQVLRAAALTVLVLACDDPTGADVFSVWVRLEGTVTTGSGSPVQGAELAFRIMYDGPEVGGEITCFGYHFPDEAELVSSDAAGAYTTSVRGLNIATPDCVEVAASPPAGSPLQPVTDTIIPEWSAGRDDGPINRLDIILPD